jgi:hypothetical protein
MGEAKGSASRVEWLMSANREIGARTALRAQIPDLTLSQSPRPVGHAARALVADVGEGDPPGGSAARRRPWVPLVGMAVMKSFSANMSTPSPGSRRVSVSLPDS